MSDRSERGDGWVVFPKSGGGVEWVEAKYVVGWETVNDFDVEALKVEVRHAEFSAPLGEMDRPTHKHPRVERMVGSKTRVTLFYPPKTVLIYIWTTDTVAEVVVKMRMAGHVSQADRPAWAMGEE